MGITGGTFIVGLGGECDERVRVDGMMIDEGGEGVDGSGVSKGVIYKVGRL